MKGTRRHPFLDASGPVGFAHRGGADEAPENTMPAFTAAVALGYRYLETDVHVTADGVVMAFHDAVLDRVTDRSGRITDLTAAEVESADAGFGFSPDGGRTHPYRGRGIPIPRLASLLEQLPDARINIDAKDDGAVEPLVALLNRHRALDRVCVGAFSDARLARLRRLAGSRLCTSMGPRAVAAARIASLGGRIRPLGARCIQVPLRSHGIRLVDRRLISAAHRSGMPVHVWTINEATAMNRLLDIGVDGIMTDRPRRLRDVMARRGLPVDGNGDAPRPPAAARETPPG